jgi:hypothetical protein
LRSPFFLPQNNNIFVYTIDKSNGLPYLLKCRNLLSQEFWTCSSIGDCHELPFDGSGSSSGLYFVRLNARGNTATQKLMLLKWHGWQHHNDLEVAMNSTLTLLLALVLCTMLLAGSLWAQDSLNVHCLGWLSLPYWSWDVAVSDSIALVAGATPTGRGFAIVDVRNLDSMTVLSNFFPLGGEPGEGSYPHIAVSGNYAYVEDNYATLKTADVSDPGSPVETSSLWWNGELSNMAVQDGYLYLGNTGFRVLSLADPAHPQEVAALDTLAWIMGLAVQNDRAYYVAWNGLRVVDITDPAAPLITGSILDTNQRYYEMVEVVGDHLFTAAHSLDDDEIQLQIYRLTTPDTPELVGIVAPIPEPLGMAAADGLVYLMDYDRRLKVFDVTVDSLPTLVGYYDAWGFDMAVVDGNLFLGTETGLRILHYEEPPQRAVPSVPTASEFALHPPYPNPFNSTTRVSFTLRQAETVDLRVYDVLGREVLRLAQGKYYAGYHEMLLPMSDQCSGTYFIRLNTPGRTATQRITLLR